MCRTRKKQNSYLIRENVLILIIMLLYVDIPTALKLDFNISYQVQPETHDKNLTTCEYSGADGSVHSPHSN